MLALQTKECGDITMPPAIERLGEIDSPCLLIIGANDEFNGILGSFLTEL